MNKKERILAETTDLFFRYGLKSITMDDISKHLGMSKKTIYDVFEDKEQLVKNFTTEVLRQKKHQIEAVIDKTPNAIAELIMLMNLMRKIFAQMNSIVFYDLQKYYPQAWSIFKDFKEKWILGIVQRNLEKGKKQGLYREEIDIRIIARLRVEVLEMAFDPTRFDPLKFNISNVQLAFTDHYLHGICTLKGFRMIDKFKKSIAGEDL